MAPSVRRKPNTATRVPTRCALALADVITAWPSTVMLPALTLSIGPATSLVTLMACVTNVPLAWRNAKTRATCPIRSAFAEAVMPSIRTGTSAA